MDSLAVKLPGLNLKNPIMPASGTFGFGDTSIAQKYDLNELGAVVLKTTTVKPRIGNPEPQIAVLGDNVLNSVGLKNPGIDIVLAEKIPSLRKKYPQLPIIASVGGEKVSDYVLIAKKISESQLVDALEINISCPNVDKGGMAFGVDPKIAYDLVKKVKAVATVPIYVKLSPNVTDIKVIAQAVEKAGADGITLINTVMGMKINIEERRSVIGRPMGGYSGPAIHAIAVRMIYEVAHAVNIPIIGVGGIESAADVIEMYLAGASAVQIGTAHFKDPLICPHIVQQLNQLMKKLNINSLEELIQEVKNNEN